MTMAMLNELMNDRKNEEVSPVNRYALLSDGVASLKVKRLKDRNETRSRDMREGRRAKKREETEIEGQEEQPGKEAKGSSAKRGAKKR
ncbi:uncharacterized protein LOC122567064 isoform X3 [Bombus pyrosoma]|uniref:uncharacterized protein LOC122567064 isoform X3 n=1 Tax=Bombus pyrosoma TaxID=396416 RepID=UPI001CB96FA2|nr:uncharacterized protein LOC122567064 isoform X3 [Bombus pyrosoma]